MRLRSLAAALCIAVSASPLLAQGGAPPAGIRRPSAAPAGDSAARAAPATSIVRGVVTDSLSNTPLVNAAVQLVRDDSARTTMTAMTDSIGSFAFERVRPGRYLIGFIHPLLDSLEIDPPVRGLNVVAGRMELVDLAVPSGEKLKAAFCGARPPGDSSGALIGFLRDADSDDPVSGGKVAVTWRELVANESGLRVAQRRVPAKSRESGFYVACDLPHGFDLLADGEAPGGRRSGLVDVRVPSRGLARFDITVADTSAAPAAGQIATGATPQAAAGEPLLRGTARLAGSVRDASGRPVPRANVSVRGAASTGASGEDGSFSLGNLPAGTRSVVVRAIGYEPRSVPVRLASGKSARVGVVLDKRVDVLTPVTVVGKTDRRTRDITGFEKRRLQGSGSYLTREDIEKRSPIYVTDAMRMMRGIQVAPNGPYGNRLLGRGNCTPTVFVDGMPIMEGANDIDTVVRPSDVKGVEVYAGGASVPAEYATQSNGCGTVLIWTGR